MTKYESIKNWAKDDKPREKLARHGKQVLSDAELLGILISSGVKEKSAIDVARDLLKNVNGNLNALARLSIKELCAVNGIGPAKAITIIAALELSARRAFSESNLRPVINGSKKAYELMRGDLQDLNYEQLWIVTLSRSNKLVGKHRISEGGIAGTVADPKRIYKTALDDHASGIIVVHNHPSGSLKPSLADKKLTNKLIKAGQLLDIAVLDHLIITSSNYYSFADEGGLLQTT